MTNIAFKQFNSISELAEFAGQRPFMTAIGYSSSQQSISQDFNEITFDDALAIARAGGRWDSGAELMQTAALNIDSARPTHKTRYKASFAGARPNVPRLLAGAQRHMITRTKTPTAHRVIKIGVNVSRAWNVEQNESINRGAAILSLIHNLESTGDRVELYATLVISDSDQKNAVHYQTLLKPAAAFFSAHDLAFALCHVDFLRRLMFAVNEIRSVDCAITHRVLGDGYGTSLSDEIKTIGKEYDIYFERHIWRGGYFNTPKKAMDRVESIAARQLNTAAAA